LRTRTVAASRCRASGAGRTPVPSQEPGTGAVSTRPDTRAVEALRRCRRTGRAAPCR
jgi:hypothetical protein